MLDNILSIVLSAIISFIFTTIICINVIDEKYGFIMGNKITNNLYIKYQDNIYKLVPIKE